MKQIARIVILCLLAWAPAAFAAVRIVTTNPDLADLARCVGGSRVEVESLGRGAQNPHFIDPKPSFMVKLREATLFIVNGLDLEIGWVPSLLNGARNPKINAGAQGYVDASQGIPVLEAPVGEVTRAEGDIHPFGNPHYLMDPLNGVLAAANIAAALERADPAGAKSYHENLSAFAGKVHEALFGRDLVEVVGGAKLERLARGGELDAFLQSNPTAKAGGWLGAMRALKDKPIVAYHKNYSYFASRFGVEIAGYVEPKPGIPPSAKHMVDVEALMKSRNIKLVVTQPFFDSRAPELIAGKTGARVLTLPSSTDQVTGVDTYFQLFDHITGKLAEAAR